MHFLIYGAGAVGQALGCLLANDGHRVTLVIRERFIKAIAQNGISVDGIFGSFHVSNEQISLTSSITNADGSIYDYILLTTKTYDTQSSLKDLASLNHCSCPVVSMQNGCGNVEQVENTFGPERSLGSRIITGFEIVAPAHVSITVSADDVHIGASQPGAIPQTADRLAKAINYSGIPTVAVEDIHQSLFAKLLYNCALNPLGAILGVSYGVLSEHDETKKIMNQVIDETFNVIKAIGGSVVWETPEHYKALFYQTLIPATYEHRPSMLQDLENHKPTEVEALVGYVSAKGKEYKIATPFCDLLGSLIRFREKHSV